ncbi:serine hydrolase domain-containing protein [Reichenbachiella versicolor]|uniref:serine hydrolase domain-containing protein n=1 Tax=Reichenbachiella versicolor TaxID=1821036 RepID=UPI000D6E0D49|nr:serine hydrolase [Reichenbachiella versicolor]
MRIVFFLVLINFHSWAQDSLAIHYSEIQQYDSLSFLNELELIVNQAIDTGAFPGCQVLLAKGDEIIFNQSFGYHTYDSMRKVQNDHLYDLASITKVAGATMALMKLYEEGKLDIDQTLGFYFPYFANSDKADLKMRKLLAHHSRMKNWIPYYQECQKKSGKYKSRTFTYQLASKYPYQIPGSQLFLFRDFYKKKLLKMIKKSRLYDEEGYIYSGLVFYLIPELVESLSGKKYEDYLKEHFYEPLGVKSIGFEPLKNGFELDEIVPTEIDNFFRMDTLHGVVHDEGAAVMLGVSGNAGLFGTASDLAKIFQMLMKGGEYDGRQYFKKATIEEFTRCQYCEQGNRRALGFDKPLIEYDPIKSSVAKNVSPNSFGHTGYTGTLVWADPDNDLLFIFLSNRVYPTRQNKLIYQLNVRPNIHDLAYDALIKE